MKQNSVCDGVCVCVCVCVCMRVVARMKLQSFTAIQSLEKPFSALFLLFAALQISKRVGWDLNPLHKQPCPTLHYGRFYTDLEIDTYLHQGKCYLLT